MVQKRVVLESLALFPDWDGMVSVLQMPDKDCVQLTLSMLILLVFTGGLRGIAN